MERKSKPRKGTKEKGYINTVNKTDFGLIKAALRRAFSRSTFHQEISNANHVPHSDPRRPRCQKWSWCNSCGEVVPTWTTDVDHIEPVDPVSGNKNWFKTEFTFEDVVTLMKRIWWCGRDNFQVLCTPCHNAKSKHENALRRQNKKLV